MTSGASCAAGDGPAIGRASGRAGIPARTTRPAKPAAAARLRAAKIAHRALPAGWWWRGSHRTPRGAGVLSQPRERTTAIVGSAAETSVRAPSTATLLQYSVVVGAISSVASKPTAAPNAQRAWRPWGTVRGSVIMEEQEDEDLGREHKDSPELPALDRAHVPACRHCVAAQCKDAEAGREREPEADRESDQPDAAEDREAADHDQRERQRETHRHWAPPEVERLGDRLAQHEENEDEADVRRVEDVPPAEADQVLREDRDRRGRREDPPTLEAPPVAVVGARDAQDEGNAVAR